MGCKIKFVFFFSEWDFVYIYFYDFGFIFCIKEIDGEEVWGFKVVVGGGFGVVFMVVYDVYDFLLEDEIIFFMEVIIWVFDWYGEWEKWMKVRMKFLIKKLGFEMFMVLVE